MKHSFERKFQHYIAMTYHYFDRRLKLKRQKRLARDRVLIWHDPDSYAACACLFVDFIHLHNVVGKLDDLQARLLIDAENVARKLFRWIPATGI
jgi:hypothetical protein